jgi:hypothetical protein
MRTIRLSLPQRRGKTALSAAAAARALPHVQDLRVHAIDSPAFTAGAEAMRDAVLEVLRDTAAGCGCHPAYHELGVHAPTEQTQVGAR